MEKLAQTYHISRITWVIFFTIFFCTVLGMILWIVYPFRVHSSTPPIVKSLGSAPLPVSVQKVLFPAGAGTPVSALHVPVLMYHYIRTVDPATDKLGYNLSVTPQNFSAQMDYLATQGYTTVTPDDLHQAVQGKIQLPAKSILLTFDDGYADFYQTAYPILTAHKFQATLFVITNFVGETDGRYVSWDQIKEMDKSGLITIGAHTKNHVDLTKSIDPGLEITGSRDALEKELGHAVTAFAYPSGRFNATVAQLVGKAGFSMAFTTQPGAKELPDSELTVPRVRIAGDTSEQSFEHELLLQAH